jgi:hypothetical protein
MFNIGPESVEKCRDVQNEPIPGKKLRGIPLGPFCKTPILFLRLKTSFSRHFINTVHSVY